MGKRVNCRMASGVAIVGAGVLALAPVTPASAATTRSLDTSVALSATYSLTPQELLVLSAQRAAGTVALAPLVPAVAGLGVLTGDQQLLSALFLQTVDAPLWVFDPALEALAQVLPEQLGGDTGGDPTNGDGDGALLRFRNSVLIDLRDAARDLVLDTFGSPYNPTLNPTAVVADGLAESAQRFAEALALAPLGVIPVAQGAITSLSGGSNKALYLALREYIDGPQYVIDPAIEGFARALTPPLGGTDGFPDQQTDEDGQLMRFRNTVLLGARDSVRKTVAGALGVDPGTGDPVTTTTTTTTTTTLSRERELKAQVTGDVGQKGVSERTDTKSVVPDTVDVKSTGTTKSERKSVLKAPGQRLERLVKRLTGTDRRAESKNRTASDTAD
jgi:hypothetical protein